MTLAGWFLVVGAVLLGVGLTQPLIRHLPITNTIVYLIAGVVLGPTALAVFHFNPLQQSGLLELITEIVVLLSLFTAGSKMPVPIRAARWRTPILLAFVSMGTTAALVAAFGVFALELPLGAAVLLGGILAPTDPVLAGDVQVRHPGDRNRLRFFITAEAGMNDGSAFPIVMLGLGLLGLHELGAVGMRWAVIDLAWATAAGIGLGLLAGTVVGRLVHGLRRHDGHGAMFGDFIGLGMVGIVYGLSLAIHAWGFLAVFFAAVALRQTETRLARRPDERQMLDREATEPTWPAATPSRGVVDGSLDVHEALERLAELTLVLLLGGTLFVSSWSWHGVATALFLFLVARPAGVLAVATDTRVPMRLRTLIGWFGVRGIGSLYYLMFAIEHGLPEGLALELLHITLIVVTLSIVLHGISVKPVLARLRERTADDRPGTG